MAQERIPPAPGPGMLWDPVHRRWVKPGQDAPYDKPTRLGPNMFKPWLEIDPEGDVFPWVAPIKPEYQLPGQGIFWHDRTNPEGGGSFSEYPHSPPQEPPTPGSGGSAPWFDPGMMQQTGGESIDPMTPQSAAKDWAEPPPMQGQQSEPFPVSSPDELHHLWPWNPADYKPWSLGPYSPEPRPYRPQPQDPRDPRFVHPQPPTYQPYDDPHPAGGPGPQPVDPDYMGQQDGHGEFEDPQNPTVSPKPEPLGPTFGQNPPNFVERENPNWSPWNVPGSNPSFTFPDWPTSPLQQTGGSIDPATPNSAASDWAVAPEQTQPQVTNKKKISRNKPTASAKASPKRSKRASAKASKSVGSKRK